MVHLQTKSRPFSCPARRQRLTFRMLPQTHEHAYRRTAIAVRADAAQYPVQGEVTAGWKWDQAKAMLIFIGPALILPLSDPLMSLIDAICLGQVRTCSRMRAQGDIVTDKLPMVCIVTSAQANARNVSHVRNAIPSRLGVLHAASASLSVTHACAAVCRHRAACCIGAHQSDLQLLVIRFQCTRHRHQYHRVKPPCKTGAPPPGARDGVHVSLMRTPQDVACLLPYVIQHHAARMRLACNEHTEFGRSKAMV